MDLDLSRAGGMSRLLRQGKASEHTLHWTGLRWVMAFLTRYKGPSQWLSRTAERLPMCPRTGKRAASECDYACFGAQRTPPSGPARSSATIHTIGAATTLPGEQQTLQAHKVGQSVGPPYAALRSAKSALGRQLQRSV